MAITLDRIEAGQVRELLFLGVVGTFAVGWLLPRLREFQKRHPFIDVRVSTNNNRVDMAAEGLDFAIRFGQGSGMARMHSGFSRRPFRLSVRRNWRRH